MATKKITKKTTAKAEPSKKTSKSSCDDKKCAIHGNTSTRGRVFKGKVVSARMERTVNIEWARPFYITKYERYEERRTRIKAHNPPCINAKEGDEVIVAETRPLSKTVKFIVIEKIR
jgi:small subunit ribosomal protein S17